MAKLALSWWGWLLTGWGALLVVFWGAVAAAACWNDLSDETSEQEHNQIQRKNN